MTVKEKLHKKIDQLDDCSLELIYKLVENFSASAKNQTTETNRQNALELLQEISDSGGLGIKNLKEWQSKMRKDRTLPLR